MDVIEGCSSLYSRLLGTAAGRMTGPSVGAADLNIETVDTVGVG